MASLVKNALAKRLSLYFKARASGRQWERRDGAEKGKGQERRRVERER